MDIASAIKDLLGNVSRASTLSLKAKILVYYPLFALVDKILPNLRCWLPLAFTIDVHCCSFFIGHTDDFSVLTLEPWIWKHLEPIRKRGTFVDVGCHIGKYTITMAGMYEKVVAIEPESGNFELLTRNCVRNGVLEKVHAVNCALWNEDGTLTMHRSSPSRHSVKFDSGKGSFKCKSKKLDTLADELGIDSIELIKIDVEGAELEVLQGGLKTLKDQRPKLVLEVWNENLNSVLKFLAAIGYECSEIPGSYGGTLRYLIAEVPNA